MQQKIKNQNLSKLMNHQFDLYTKSIIQQRALPDVRDGLKPVQRRILYAMLIDHNTVDKAYKKSARAIGNVMGNFHPHGDSSIYGALIDMSQSWKMRVPLIDLHGNNGSIDDDPPAAMRYTEARLSKISNEMMRNLKDDTVNWVPTFDDTKYEPTVLPSRFPNLIVNGAKGIASGYATEIPPHNLGEAIDAIVYLQQHPHATLDDIMQFIKGPDFPTGGVLQGVKGLKQAYKTGRGKVVLRARHHVIKLRGGKHQINITEIPYGVNKKQLVHQITAIQINQDINGIDEVRDDSDRHGLSIKIIVKRGTDAQSTLDYLYKHTDLQIFYHFNVVAIDNAQPKLMSLKALLVSYLDFQRAIVRRRTKYHLNQIKIRQEIVLGYIKALSIIEQIVQIVKNSNGRTNASNKLIQRFKFTKRQANAIVTLRLYRLSKVNLNALKAQNRVLNHKANYCKKVLNNHDILDAVLRKELLKIKDEYNTPRRTSIWKSVRQLHISKKITIPDEEVEVCISHDGYLKRSSLRSYKSSLNNKKNGNGLRPGDYALFIQKMNDRDHLLIFTDQGRVIYRPVNNIKEVRWKDTGTNISQDIQMKPTEQIVRVFGFKTLKHAGQFLMGTSDGYAKRTNLKDLMPGRTYRHHAPNYIKLRKHSKVVNITYLPNSLPKSQLMILTRHGFAVRIDPNSISVSGAKAAGVRSIHLHKNDQVVGMQLVNNSSRIVTVDIHGNANCFTSRTAPLTLRDRVGQKIMYHTKTHPANIVTFLQVSPLQINKPLTIYTQVRRKQKFVPAQLGMISASQHGKKVINVNKLGEPSRMMF